MNPCCKCHRHRHQQSRSDDVMRKASGFESKTEFWGLSEPGGLFSRLTNTWALTAAREPRTWLHSSRFFSTASERPCTFRIHCQNLGTFFKAISDVTLPENLPPNSLLFSQKVAFSLSMFSWGLVSASLILLLPPVKLWLYVSSSLSAHELHAGRNQILFAFLFPPMNKVFHDPR